MHQTQPTVGQRTTYMSVNENESNRLTTQRVLRQAKNIRGSAYTGPEEFMNKTDREGILERASMHTVFQEPLVANANPVRETKIWLNT
jgi:hypothetical protein